MPRRKLSWEVVKSLIENHFRHDSRSQDPTVQQYHYTLLDNIPDDEDGDLPPLAASSLSLQDIKDIFNIEEEERSFHNVLQSQLLTVPPELGISGLHLLYCPY